MLRPLSLLPALVALVATLAGPVPVAVADRATPDAAPSDRSAAPSRGAARTAPVVEGDPLLVTIDDLTPSYIPREGQVRVTGTVTNRSDDVWQAINVHPFVSELPIRSSRALAAAHDVDPAEYVGERLYAVGTFDTVGNLRPGESATFAIRLRRQELDVTAAGVYWFGVHAMAEGPDPRDSVADGRARTFLSLMPRRLDEPVETAIVVPVRHPVVHAEDGRVARVRRWAQDLTSGPLRSLVDLGASAGSRPVTWLVDPAVPEAVRRLTEGNAARSLADTVEPEGEPGQDQGDGSPSPDPSDGPAASQEPGDEPEPEPEEVPQNPATAPGQAWLDRFREAISGDQVLALPYGDLDVSAALERDPATYRQARQRTGTQLEPFGVETDRAVSSPSGYLDPGTLGGIDPRDTVLVDESMTGGPGSPAVVRSGGTRMVVGSSAAYGGPGPGDRLAGVPLRQQVLAEAAVRALEDRPRPLVVVLPPTWSGGPTGFFDGLEVPWVDLVEVEDLGDRRGERIEADRLTYPELQTRRELDAANFTAAASLVEAGETLQNVLLRNDRIAAVVRDEAFTALSYAGRRDPNRWRVTADRARTWILGRLGRVQVTAPPKVILSSTSGRFSATLTNDLEHPVRVRVRAITDGPMVIEGPDLIEIGAESRSAVLLNATTDRLGVSNVRLLVTDEDGTPLGATDSLPIRSARVSEVIWLIIGTGVALLFGAIIVRLVRRVRRERAAT